MKIPNLIKTTRRKLLRYVMFRRRLFELEGTEMDFSKKREGVSNKNVETIIKFYEAQENFKGWDEFSETWDIGIRDKVTMISRPEKFFLFGIYKSNIVDIEDRPALISPMNGDNTVDGKLSFTLSKIGFGEYFGPQKTNERGVINTIDYDKILLEFKDKNSWNDSGLKLISTLESERLEEEKRLLEIEDIL